MNQEIILGLDELSLSFELRPSSYVEAISGVSFQLARGETVALLGESGCGKSLTASAIMNLLPNNSYVHQGSKILFDQANLLDKSEAQMREYRGIKMAMIFQEPMTSLNPVLTIGYQLQEVFKRQQSLTAPALRQKAISLLTLVEMPDPKRCYDSYPHQLSGGQKQRVMIAMAIAATPDVLIADEPTTALDVTIQKQILGLLKSLSKKMNMALLLITHDLGVVNYMADQVVVMYAGQVVEQVNSQEFFSQPLHPYSQKLLECLPSLQKKGHQLNPILGMVPALEDIDKGCRFYSRCHQAQAACRDAVPLFNVTEGQTPRQVRCLFYQQQGRVAQQIELNNEPRRDVAIKAEKSLAKKPILVLEGVKIHYPIYSGLLRRQQGVVKAVDDVSFTLKQGETLALVGESGCGKTTLSKGISQLVGTTAGRILIDGQCVTKRTAALASQVQVIFQDPYSSMNPRMLVSDIIAEGLDARKDKQSAAQKQQKIKALLDMVGLPASSMMRYPHEFSGGQRQRISIARALAVSPKLLICDEPTSALDVSIQAQILNLLQSLQAELNLSYLFISHDISVVSYLSDRVLIMQAGRIVEQGPTQQILVSPQHDYTKSLLSSVLEV